VVENQAWHEPAPASSRRAEAGAAALRYELIRGAVPLGEPAGATRVLLEHAIDLDPRAEYLMRADRVDFRPRVRCRTATGRRHPLSHRRNARRQPWATRPPGGHAGGAWFESGREPVLAVASKDEPTSFIRVILPRELRGRTSIMYVNPSDASAPRSYTVYVDEPIEIA